MTDYLAHHGVKGMKWGKRKAVDRLNDTVRSNAHESMRDATVYGYANESDQGLRKIAVENRGRAGYSLSDLKRYRASDRRNYKQARNVAAASERYNTLKKRGSKRIKDYIAMAQSVATMAKYYRDDYDL